MPISKRTVVLVLAGFMAGFLCLTVEATVGDTRYTLINYLSLLALIASPYAALWAISYLVRDIPRRAKVVFLMSLIILLPGIFYYLGDLLVMKQIDTSGWGYVIAPSIQWSLVFLLLLMLPFIRRDSLGKGGGGNR